MLSEENYKELLRYQDAPISVGIDGLSEREVFLKEKGFITEAEYKQYPEHSGIVGIYPHSYKITAQGKDAILAFECERDQKAENKKHQRFQDQVSVAAVLVPAITFILGLIVEHFSGIVGLILGLFR